MSFMSIKGAIYHCKSCGKNFTVEYEGGLKSTQIGEMNVLKQKYLENVYGYSEEYFHEEVLCSDCIKTTNALILDKTTNLFSDIDELNSQYSEEFLYAVKNEMHKFLSDLSLDQSKIINPLIFEKTIGYKAFKLKGLRPKLINTFLNESNEKILKYLRDSITNTNHIQNMLSKYDKQYAKILNKINKLDMNGKSELYLKYEVGPPENLNDFIINVFTIRVPVSTTPKYTFYNGPYEIPEPQKLDLNELFERGTYEFVELFYKRLSELCDI